MPVTRKTKESSAPAQPTPPAPATAAAIAMGRLPTAPPKAVVRNAGCVRAYGLGLSTGPLATRAQTQLLQAHSRALAEENRRLRKLLDEAIGLVGGAAEDFARREKELESDLGVALAAIARHRGSGPEPGLEPGPGLGLGSQ